MIKNCLDLCIKSMRHVEQRPGRMRPGRYGSTCKIIENTVLLLRILWRPRRETKGMRYLSIEQNIAVSGILQYHLTFILSQKDINLEDDDEDNTMLLANQNSRSYGATEESVDNESSLNTSMSLLPEHLAIKV